MEVPAIELKIQEEVEFLKHRYFAFDEPVPLGGLSLYPVPLRNYNEFMACTSCLTLNRYDDIQGLRRTNMGYLLYKIEDEKEGPQWAAKFSRLLELCLHVRPGLKCAKCGAFVSYEEYVMKFASAKTPEEQESLSKCPKCDCEYTPSLMTKDIDAKRKQFVIDGHEIDDDTFNRLRKYILYQNLPDYYDDTYVVKELRDDEKRKQEMLSKNSGSATLEEKICAVAFQTGMSLEDVQNLPIRKFMIFSKQVNDYTEYLSAKIGLMSGMVKLKDGQTIDHWLYHKQDNNRYGANVSADDLIKGVRGG